MPFIDVAAYNFAAQSPGGTLSVGSNPITLSPVPPGIATSFIGQYLYISGGVGAAEAALVTGVSGTTITVTCANSHSGAWTIQSAAGGVAEAISAGGVGLYIASANPATFYAPVTLPNNSFIQIQGDSFFTPAVVRGPGGTTVGAGTLATADLFYSPGSGSDFSLFNLSINNGPGDTGRAIHIVSGTLHMLAVRCLGGIFVDLDSSGLSQISDFIYFSSGSPSAVFIYRGTTSNSASTSASLSTGQILAGNSTGYGVEITGVDYLRINNVLFNGMAYGVYAKPGSNPIYISDVLIDGCQFDAGTSSSPAVSGVYLAGGPNIGNIQVMNSNFNGEGNLTSLYGIDAGFSITGALYNVTISNNQIYEWGHAGIAYSRSGAGDSQFTIAGNTLFANCQASPTYSGELLLSTPQGVSVTGNTIGGSSSAYSIYWLAVSASSDTLISQNNLKGSATAPIFLDSALPASVIIKENIGISDVIPAVASAATLVFPISPNFTISGNTNVTAVNMDNVAAASTGNFRTTGAAITFTAGGGIGNTLTTTQNVPVIWIYDGTSLWLA